MKDILDCNIKTFELKFILKDGRTIKEGNDLNGINSSDHGVFSIFKKYLPEYVVFSGDVTH